MPMHMGSTSTGATGTGLVTASSPKKDRMLVGVRPDRGVRGVSGERAGVVRGGVDGVSGTPPTRPSDGGVRDMVVTQA